MTCTLSWRFSSGGLPSERSYRCPRWSIDVVPFLSDQEPVLLRIETLESKLTSLKARHPV